MTHTELMIWRVGMKLSQRKAAEALGIQLKAYQEMERGTRFKTGLPAPISKRTELACKALKDDDHGVMT